MCVVLSTAPEGSRGSDCGTGRGLAYMVPQVQSDSLGCAGAPGEFRAMPGFQATDSIQN